MAIFGATISAFAGGFIADRVGRKLCILGSSALFIIGPLILAISPFIFLLNIGRVVVGLAIGLSQVCGQIYLSECSPKKFRGQIIAAYWVAVNSGFVLANVIAVVLPNRINILLLIAIIPAVA